jgi:hypothetical protein
MGNSFLNQNSALPPSRDSPPPLGHVTNYVTGHMLDPLLVSLSHDHMSDPFPVWPYEMAKPLALTLCPKPLTLSPLP